jgi:hypothetical protein
MIPNILQNKSEALVKCTKLRVWCQLSPVVFAEATVYTFRSSLGCHLLHIRSPEMAITNGDGTFTSRGYQLHFLVCLPSIINNHST